MAALADRVVVVDANFVGRGHFRLEALRKLAERLANRGHVLVVPEVVVWEWAHHAHEVMAEALIVWRRVESLIDESLGIDCVEFDLPPVTELADRITARLEAVGEIIIFATDPDYAVAAIKQQVLQIGVGTRSKQGTKTGAADALVLAAVEHLLDDYEEVVLASGDGHLGSCARQADDRVVVVRDQRELWQWHGLTPPTIDDLAEVVSTFLEQDLRENLALGQSFPLFEQGEWIDTRLLAFAGFNTQDSRQTDVSVEALDDIEVANLEVVVGDEVPRLVVADVRVTASALIVNWFIGGPDAELIDEWTTEDVEIKVSISVELDDRWQVLSYDADDKADVVLREI